VAIAALVTGAIVAGGYYGYHFITTSERFAVRAIEVHGNEAVTAAEIQALMGVAPGDNIFAIELGAMTRAIESDPTIARASVRRELPGTLIVEVEENQPAALVELGGLYLADREGRVFKRAAIERGDGRGLPVITGLSRAAYVSEPEAVHVEIREALGAAELYQSGEDAFERPALGEINLHRRHGITFTMYERAVALRVGRGDLQALRERLHAFDIAWQALTPRERHQARIVYADASTRPDRVTIGFEHTEQIATE
jgi:cell division protein FtsQ